MKKKIIISVLVIIVLVSGALFWGVDYLVNYAMKPGEKDFLDSSEDSGIEENKTKNWSVNNQKVQILQLKSRDGLQLKARYFSHETGEKKQGKKLAILAHGYGNSSANMENFAQLFYDLGYDVLLPDARAHGMSEGEYIGFGWPERFDYVDWIDQMLSQYPKDVEIVLYGISMGGATVMMTSGEKLPSNVKAIIEDCGYDTVENELAYQLKQQFDLPSFPLIPLACLYADFKVGYNPSEASSVNQLKKNNLPILFIHGDQDDFVPTTMVYPNYDATNGPKELKIVKGAKHAESYDVDPKEYQTTVENFLHKYLEK